MKIKILFCSTILFVSCTKKSENIAQIEDLAKIEYISLKNTDRTIVLGKTINLKVSHYPQNALEPEYQWFSSSPEVISVDSNGVITANSIGYATITAKIKDTNIQTDHTFSVIPEKITSLNVESPIKEIFVGEIDTIKLTILPKEAKESKILWETADSTIAKISNNGIITGVSNGSTTIKISNSEGNISISIDIKVKKEIEYSNEIFNNIKSRLIDSLMFYNEQKVYLLADELKAERIGYIVLADSDQEQNHISSHPEYGEAKFSNLIMPPGKIRKLRSNFYLSLFPNTSRMGNISLEINFFEKSWELKINNPKSYKFKYSDNVSIQDLKKIIDNQIDHVRKYINAG